jgi:VWFA-related protein
MARAGLCGIRITQLVTLTASLCLYLAASTPLDSQHARIRTTTRLVQVSVIVQDKHGQSVTGLRKEDFTLWDAAIPQKIQFFSAESTGPTAQAHLPLPSDTFTNRPERREGAPTSVTVILLDGLNTQFQDQASAKNQIVRFLEQIHPDDHVALYVLGERLRILHDFTSDARPLLRALARYKGRASPELAAESLEGMTSASLADEEMHITQELQDLADQSLQTLKDFYLVRRVEITLRSLQAVANHVARLPGRKNLLWVSAAFPLSFGDDALDAGVWRARRQTRSFGREIEEAVRAISNANLAVYPIDARGLVGVPALDASKSTVDGLDFNRNTLDTTMWYDQLALSVGTMKTIANRTGGRVFYNSNDIFGAVRSAVEEARVTYTLGYYPSHQEWDGRFHEVRVRVKRSGLRVRHRAGYFALADETLGEEQRRAKLDDAAWSPLEATSIGLVAKVEPELGPGGRFLSLKITLDSRDLALRQEKGRWVGTLDFLFAQPDAEGRTLGGRFGTLDLNLTPESYRRMREGGLTVNQRVRVESGAHELRVVFRDRTSGAVGSVHIPLSRFLE